MSARKKPVRFMHSSLTNRFYCVTDYVEHEDGRITAKTKHDVTDDVHAIFDIEVKP